MPRGLLTRLLLAASSFAFLLMASLRAMPGPADNSSGIFPLDKGTYWIFRGPVESENDNETFKKEITWKMEITDVLARQDIRAAGVKGFPTDLWWYSEKTQPTDCLLVQLFPARFYLVNQTDVPAALKALRDDKNLLQGLVKESQLFFEFPMAKGQRFGETELVTRSDGFYSWVVSDVRHARLEGIQGVPATKEWTIYTLIQFTTGSHEEFDFVPGLGITRYMGHHNGTVSDFEMKLVEFHPGASRARP